MRIKHDEEIKLELQKILEDKSILADRIYVPSRNSIKVVFYTEGELNKVLDDKNYFIEEGYEPRLSMALKATRTVFCTGFDRALLQTYSKEKIQELLEEKGWEVRGIFIMKNKYNFKIEFKTKEIATKFLANINTEIGGIKLTQQSKEREVDPTIDQCWTCGIINPDHKNCQVLVCLKCGDGDHNFFDCRIPRKTEQRTSQQKDACYCIPCNRKGDHTSLDSFCPKKREIVQQRIQMIKNEKERENQEKQKDINLIKRVLDFSNRETWPLPGNKNQTAKYSAIISLALLDEATHPGQNKFQIKLTNGCKDNNLPTLNYRPEPKTAEIFFNAMSYIYPPLSCDSSSLELESHVFKICRTILPSEKIIHMCYFLQKCLLRCLARKPQNEQIPHATCNGLRMHRSDVHFASDKVHLSEHTAVSQQIHNPKEVSETRPIFVKQQSF